MIQTKLLNLRSFKLEQYGIDSMPPYVAISHVWSENLFPSALLTPNTAIESDGMSMLVSAFAEDPDFQGIDYIWVDTWCIDQSDEEDKLRQIPEMATIYKNAEVTAVIIRHIFSFTQTDWSQIISNLAEDIEWFTSLKTLDLTDLSRMQLVTASKDGLQASSILAEIAEIPWNSRIWTAQEYILAKKVVFIDYAHKAFRFEAKHLKGLTRILAGGLPDLTSWTVSTQTALNGFAAINDLRRGFGSPGVIMHQVENRRSESKVDEVYGLMSASGVIIPPIPGETVEMAWVRWWEASVIGGCFTWIVLSMAFVEEVFVLSSLWNCAMPPAETRVNCMLASGCHVATAFDSAPFKSVGLQEGAIQIWGRSKGKLRINFSFEDEAMPKNLEDLSLLHAVNPERVKCFLLALQYWTRLEVADILTRCEQQHTNPPSSKNDSTARKVNWGLRMLNDFGCFPPTSLYIGSLQSISGSEGVEICFFAANGIPQGELFALDVNATIDNETSLMIVQKRADGLPPLTRLHKIGMTRRVRRPDSQSMYEEMIEDVVCLPYDDSPLQQFSIGGKSCLFCQSWKEGTHELLVFDSNGNVIP